VANYAIDVKKYITTWPKNNFHINITQILSLTL